MANVKTVGGLALASMKTWGGLAAASVKTIDGVDATSSSHGTAPVFVAEAHLDRGNSGGAFDVTGTINAGDTVVVFICVSANQTVSTLTDSGGSTYTKQASKVDPNSTAFVVEVWTTLSANASTKITVTATGTSVLNVCFMRYTGVSAIGNTGTSGSQFPTTQSVSATMQDTNNQLVACLLARSAFGVATASAGTIRVNNYKSAQGSTSITTGDNTSASTGSLAFTITTASGEEYFGIAVELRSI